MPTQPCSISRSAGYTSVFQQLVACIISIRTLDEVSLPVAIGLLDRAPTPEKMAKLSVAQIDALIHASSFHEAKAAQIREIAKRTVAEFGGELPCDFDVLTSFKGVGPKCANLTMGVACGTERISVDIHVHRVTNRWGYVSARRRKPRCARSSEAAARVLGGDQPAARAVREAHLHGRAPQVLDVSGARVLPPGGGDDAPLGMERHPLDHPATHHLRSGLLGRRRFVLQHVLRISLREALDGLERRHAECRP